MRVNFENNLGFFYDIDDDFLYCVGEKCECCQFKEHRPNCATQAKEKASDIINSKLNAIVDILMKDLLNKEQKVKKIYDIIWE